MRPRSLALLGSSEAWSVALATGAWFRTAEFKLRAAGIDPTGLPIATSDDHHTRAGIVRTAIRRAEQRLGHSNRFEAIVAVGDGSWDVTTAAEMGIPFIRPRVARASDGHRSRSRCPGLLGSKRVSDPVGTPRRSLTCGLRNGAQTAGLCVALAHRRVGGPGARRTLRPTPIERTHVAAVQRFSSWRPSPCKTPTRLP